MLPQYQILEVSSTVIELTITPLSNDIVPVRDQIVEIDISNSNITVTADSFVGGSRWQKYTQQHQALMSNGKI